ncbi:MAG: GspE/PulE family protein [Erysipelotrichaceae bacterium]
MIIKFPITKLLFKHEKISKDKETEIKEAGKKYDNSEMELLNELGIMSEANLIDFLAKLFRMEIINLEEEKIEGSTISLFPYEVLFRIGALPFNVDNENILIAICDPTQVMELQTLNFYTDKKLEFKLATRSSLYKVLTLFNSKNKSSEAVEVLSSEFETVEEVNENDLDNNNDDAPTIKLTNSILSEAITFNASDIHIEPFEKLLKIRYRVDGKLKEVMSLPMAIYPAIIARMKMISGMDITERRTPQEGRMEVTLLDKEIDIRFSTLPNVFGEKMVLRLLKKDFMNQNLSALGLNKRDFGKVKAMLERKDGIILVTGPTGSGKSTTLYSFLGALWSPEKSLVTVEDPVEYTIEGFNQTQVNSKQGMTFPVALRAILRQDPDIIMIGEIRDEETANIAVRSSITGHLVLSTLHTNSALSSIARLVDMGIAKYLIADSFRGVIAQRLLRKLCPDCKEAYTSTPSEMEMLRINKPVTLYRPCGCKKCNEMGYRGRFAIFEVLHITKTMKDSIQNNASMDELKRVANEDGMNSLFENAIYHVLAGNTSIQELGGLDDGTD